MKDAKIEFRISAEEKAAIKATATAGGWWCPSAMLRDLAKQEAQRQAADPAPDDDQHPM